MNEKWERLKKELTDFIEEIDFQMTQQTLKELPKAKPKKRFMPPTVGEVKAYNREKGYTFDAETFVNFYESKNWYVGKTKMVSWKACCTTWQKREKKDEKVKRNSAAEVMWKP